MKNSLIFIPQKLWAYLALIAWGALSFVIVSKIPYGIDEGAARALLLVWAVSGDVVSPVVTLGLPDFRSLFFIPVGYLWPGNLVAAKIFTLLVMASAAWAIYRWRQQSGDSESGLLATGLLLISPLIINQIDTISVAPYLLIVFAWGAWLDRIYRDLPHPFGGAYFAQIILSLVSVTLHPAGIAYPLSLLWAWHENPVDQKQKKSFYFGIIFTVLLGLILTMGWSHIHWFTNPVRSLSEILHASTAAEDMGIAHWLSGTVLLLGVLYVITKQLRILLADFLGRALLIAFCVGLLSGDSNWSVISLSIGLYWGLPMLLGNTGKGGFWGQRGPAFLVIFVISTVSMIADKVHYQNVQSEKLNSRDELIRYFAEDSGYFRSGSSAQNASKADALKVASQWPGLTMLACRCDVFPLPDAAKDGDALLRKLKSINLLIFDPKDPENSSLSGNLAMLDAGKADTIALHPGGVVVEIKNPGQTSVVPDQAK